MTHRFFKKKKTEDYENPDRIIIKARERPISVLFNKISLIYKKGFSFASWIFSFASWI